MLFIATAVGLAASTAIAWLPGTERWRDPAPRVYSELVAAAAIVAILVSLSFVVRRARFAHNRPLAFLIPIVSVVATTTINIATNDASAGAQIFLLLPVMHAAYQFYPAGAVVVTALAIVAQNATAWLLLPPAPAFNDAFFAAVIIATSAGVLVHARTARDATGRALAQRARIDPLTGLMQRHVLDTALAQALARAGSGGTALVMLDIDYFKAINDQYGHPVGDAALRHVAEVVRARVRPGDMVSRMGGDELAILLEDSDLARATERATAVIAAIAATPLDVAGQPVSLSATAGVGHAPPGARRVEALYHAADDALYRAKRDGRGRVGGPA